jgi:SHS2 domain-containing protein
VLAHTADTGIEAEAQTLGELYAVCAGAMFDMMVAVSDLRPTHQVVVRVPVSDPAETLVDLLAQLLALAEIDGVVVCAFEVRRATETEVELAAGGVPASAVDLEGPPVKAVTYHDLEVARTADGWRARVLFDV